MKNIVQLYGINAITDRPADNFSTDVQYVETLQILNSIPQIFIFDLKAEVV